MHSIMKKLTIEFLKTRHTKELLDLFRSLSIQHLGDVYCLGFWWDASDVSVDDIRKLLSTREHVPNKHESREARIKRKKSGSRRGRGDR